MPKVFITGATGFLGSNISEVLIKSGYSIMSVYRNKPPEGFCWWQANRVEWIRQDRDWESKVIAYQPDVIIHAAWIGVEHADRDSWECQLANIDYLKNLLLIAEKCNVKKFIGLGSQAEYGTVNGCITEEEYLNPAGAYGSVKIICSELIKHFCNANQIDWYWLRLFSFFGKGESNQWLIPSIVSNLLTVDQMAFTPGEQRYAYLYAEDLGQAIKMIIEKRGQAGIYNVSGKNAIRLKDLISEIRDKINPNFKLNFGALSYRENQPMLMQGSCTKFVEQFGEFELSDFNASLDRTIGYLVEKFKGEW